MFINDAGYIEIDDSKYVEMYDESKDAFVYNKKANNPTLIQFLDIIED